MTMRPLLFFLPLAAIACAAGTAGAQTRRSTRSEPPCDDDNRGGAMDVTVQVKPGGIVDVREFGGTVHVTTWAQNAVHVKGQFGSECHIDVAPSGEREEIELRCSHGPGTGDLEVQIPQASSVDVRTMSADVSVEGVNGFVRLQTVTGDIGVRGGTPTEIEARTTSGGVKIQAATPSTRAHSVSGDVQVIGVRGRATIRTVSGECTLSGGEFNAVEIESVSGDIVFHGAPVGPGAFEMQSHSGDVALHLPPTTGAEVEMRTISGDLVIDMGSGRKTAERELDARIGSGGAKVRLHTYSGDIGVTQ
jgi:putative adhesin